MKQILILDFRSKPQKVSTNINKNFGFFGISIIFLNMQAVTKVQKTTKNHSKRHRQKNLNGNHHSKPHNSKLTHATQVHFLLFHLTTKKNNSNKVLLVHIDDQQAIIAHNLHCVYVIFFLCLVIRSKNKRYVKIIWNKLTKTNIQSKPVSTSFEVKTYNHCLHQLSVCFDNRIPFS